MAVTRTEHARQLFDGIAPAYDTPAEVFSFGQYGRWRRFAVSRLELAPGALVLDVATGTGLVAGDVARRYRARVVGLDQSTGMLRRARSRGFALVGGSAERLPFRGAAFDALTFTYLLRYVEDPAATLRELVRVLKPGAPMASVEFGLPGARWSRPLWDLYALRILPLGARALSPGWRDVGGFLGHSILAWGTLYPPEAVVALWRDAGIDRVRTRALSFGAGVITWGRKA